MTNKMPLTVNLISSPTKKVTIICFACLALVVINKRRAYIKLGKTTVSPPNINETKTGLPLTSPHAKAIAVTTNNCNPTKR